MSSTQDDGHWSLGASASSAVAVSQPGPPASDPDLPADAAQTTPMLGRGPLPGALLPPFSSQLPTHLPTPMSPHDFASYANGVANSPESPLVLGSRSLRSPIPLGLGMTQQRPRGAAGPQGMVNRMTPESSPLTDRVSGRFRAAATTPPLSHFPPVVYRPAEGTPTAHRIEIKMEEPVTPLAPAPHIISPPLSVRSEPTPTNPNSRLSPPFMAKLNLGDRARSTSASPRTPAPIGTVGHPAMDAPTLIRPVLVDDIFTQSAASTSSGGHLPGIPVRRTSPGAFDRLQAQVAEEEALRLEELELRRPDYLTRAKRPASPSLDDFEDQDRVLPGLGITVSPVKGRRLKLFQETSAESFEESLLAGGYGKYRTIPEQPSTPTIRTLEWLEQATPGPAGPSSNSLEQTHTDTDTIPDERELQKRKRLAAFQSTRPARPSTKLCPVELEGIGRVLMNVDDRELMGAVDDSPARRRANRRKKKGPLEPRSPGKRKATGDGSPVDEPEVDGPDWTDAEFPWSVRAKERAEGARMEQEDRLQWIERYLDRDSDDEPTEQEEELLPSSVWGQVYEDPPMPSRKGRGKMVPFKARHKDKPAERAEPESGMYFPTDPANAKAALLSKRIARNMAFIVHRGVGEGPLNPEADVLCICRGPDDGRSLVQCDECQKWYHLQCIGIHDVSELGREEDPWFCGRCASGRPSAGPGARTPSPELSREPTLVPSEGTPRRLRQDPLFFQGVLQESPMPSWGAGRAPTTPGRGERDGRADSHIYSSRSSWSDDSRGHDPSTPHSDPLSVRVYSSTPGPFDGHSTMDEPFDPTSTPSRGIKFGAPFATPRAGWSSRAGGLFQTPSRTVRSSFGGPRSSLSGFDEVGASLSPTRGAMYGVEDMTLGRGGRPGEGPRTFGAAQVFDSPLPSLMAKFPEASMEDSPVMHARRHMKRPPGFMSLTAEES